MRFTLDYFLLNAYLAIILPIAIYCLVLGQINRRPTGVMVNGVWDSIGLLFAGSGILLVTLPTLLVRQFAASMFDWYVAWIAYYLLLILGGALLVWSRRSATVVYNVDPAYFHQVVDQALEKLGMPGSWLGHTVMFQKPAIAEAEVAEAIPHGIQAANVAQRFPEETPPPTGQDQLEIDPFPAMANVTLHWRIATPNVRQEIEDELSRHLEECRALDNPAAAWFTIISIMLFCFILGVIGLMVWEKLR